MLRVITYVNANVQWSIRCMKELAINYLCNYIFQGELWWIRLPNDLGPVLELMECGGCQDLNIKGANGVSIYIT